MTRFRTRVGPSGCEKLLELKIAAGFAPQAVRLANFPQVKLTNKVQEKAIAFPPLISCITRAKCGCAHGGNTLELSCDKAVFAKVSNRCSCVSATRRPGKFVAPRTVECISKGKPHKKYQFGVKVSWL